MASLVLPASEPGPTVRRQLAKCATGVAFNYRASCRARSHAEFTAKIGVVAEEVDEAQGWLEFTEAGKLVQGQEVTALLIEASQLAAIFSASVGLHAKERASVNSALSANRASINQLPDARLSNTRFVSLPSVVRIPAQGRLRYVDRKAAVRGSFPGTQSDTGSRRSRPSSVRR